MNRTRKKVGLMKNALLLLLAMTMLLAACSSGGTKESPSPSPSADNNTSPSPDASEQKEKLTLNWFVHGPNNSNLPAGDKDFVKKAIEEKFNVTLNIEHMEIGADFTTKLNLKLTGKGAPDMFMADGAASNNYIKDGLAMDMTEIVSPTTMPNYFKNWVQEDELERYAVQGKFMRAPVPFAKQQYFSFYIRQDWIDNLNAKGVNVKRPTTYEEMEQVMDAFVNNDPDNNGKNDTFGLVMWGEGKVVYAQWPQYLKHGMFGLSLDGDYFIDGYSDLRVEHVLDEIRDWMDKGYVDQDWFLRKNADVANVASQGKAGIIWNGDRRAAFDNYPNGIQYQTVEVLKSAGKADEAAKVNWQPFHPFAETGVGVNALPGVPFLFFHDTTKEKAERSVEILDWLASEEGYLLVRYGEEGKHYTRDGNKITINTDAVKTDIVDQGDFLRIYQFFATPDEPKVFDLEVIYPDETDRDRAIQEHVMTYKYMDSIGTNVAPPDGYNLADFRNQLYATHAKILFDQKDSSNWPELRDELMEKYGGRVVFNFYAEQISAAHGRTIEFKDLQ